MFNRTDKLISYLDNMSYTLKGYANEKTLIRALKKGHLDALKSFGLDLNLEIHAIPSGPNKGRLLPVLVFGPREEVPVEAFHFAHGSASGGKGQGLLLFKYRA